MNGRSAADPVTTDDDELDDRYTGELVAAAADDDREGQRRRRANLTLADITRAKSGSFTIRIGRCTVTCPDAAAVREFAELLA